MLYSDILEVLVMCQVILKGVFCLFLYYLLLY